MGSDKKFRDCNEEIEFYYGGGMSSSPSRSPSPSDAAVIHGVNCIIHPVSKFDTLAGVAIKYGVEVSDIKRLNGLVTDLQMFALKTIQIPLPGRHPPSPVCTTDLQRTSSSEQQSRRQSDFFDSFQSLKLKSCSDSRDSSAMDSLRGFYGLRPSFQDSASQGCEISVYQNGEAHYLEDGAFARSLYNSNSNPPLSHHRKSKSVANYLSSGNGYLVDPLLSKEADNNETPDRWMEKVLRRRQKSEADFTKAFRTPEKLLKEEFSNGSVISPITGKSLALRPKSGNRAVSGGVDGENGGFTSVPIGPGDSNSADGMNAAVRKSSSTSNLSDSENSTLSSIWPTSKWNLKSDFPIPIFDGLPPMGRRNKAALD